MVSTRRIGLCLTVVVVLATGCGTEPPHETGEDAPAQAPADADTSAAVAPEITIAPVSQIEPALFPHSAHESVDCATCHAAVPGHSGHSGLVCAACHEAPSAAGAAVTAAECNACHHGTEQTRACRDCHGDRAPASRHVAVSARLSSGSTQTVLSLPFDHEVHVGLECGACHSTGGATPAAGSCASCHDSHHDESRTCSTCHAGRMLERHDRTAHVGCGGAGCHQDSAVLALDAVRPVCLVCHARQQDHEPGLECTDCHPVGASAEPRPGADEVKTWW